MISLINTHPFDMAPNSGHIERPVSRCGTAGSSTSSGPKSAEPRTTPTMDPEDQDDMSGLNLSPSSGLLLLIKKLRILLGTKGLASEDIDIKQVKRLMEEYKSDEADWEHLALHDPSRNYSRNGIFNINGNANLLILVWNPGKSSAIHDHANAHCCMKILKGELTESLYDIPRGEGSELVARQHTAMHREEVGYISDDIGLHKISNLGSDLAVSLHLYTPPYASMYGCSMYEAGNGKKHHVDMSKYYSWQGKLVNPNGGSTC